jgi:hypothetical protein
MGFRWTKRSSVTRWCVFNDHSVEGSVDVNLRSTRYVLAIGLLTAFCGLHNEARGADAPITVITDVSLEENPYFLFNPDQASMLPASVDTIEAVFLGGRLIPRETLSAAR